MVRLADLHANKMLLKHAWDMDLESLEFVCGRCGAIYGQGDQWATLCTGEWAGVEEDESQEEDKADDGRDNPVSG